MADIKQFAYGGRIIAATPAHRQIAEALYRRRPHIWKGADGHGHVDPWEHAPAFAKLPFFEAAEAVLELPAFQHLRDLPIAPESDAA